MTASSAATSLLSVRISAEERAMLEAAARQTHTNVGDFVRRKALEAAEVEVLSRSVATISAKDWEAFEGWLSRPAETIPGLEELAARLPTWQR